MWILENEGYVLGGRRIWLRPGKKYLFGRTKPEGVSHTGFIIDHKSVSRRHLTLTVAPVNRGDGSKVYTRSELTIVDEDTKLGTEIDGARFRGGKKVLKNDEHVFRLGSSDCPFRLTWQPVVLSFTFPSKETKAGKDPLAPTRALLEDLDIKTTILYVVGKTTHVVSSKRNTAKCLQALINGIHIVDNSYVDALVYATSPENLDEFESLSPLEEDFDKNWPPEADHLPPAGKEPNPRPPALFEPNAARTDIFERYTFIFCDPRQFENLQAPINNGGGKALYYEVETKVTTAADLIRHFREVSGVKDGASLQESHEGRKVLLVRFVGEKGNEEWAKEVQREAAIQLNRQLVEQNEFLDVILTKAPGKLERTVTSLEGRRELSSLASSITPEARSPNRETTATSMHSTNGAVALRRSRTRGAVQSAFRGFDDGFDPSQVQAQKRAVAPNSQNRVGSRAASQDFENSLDEDAIIAPANRRSNKRPAPSDIEEEDKMDTELLPAAAAMKRRRIEEEDTARRDGVPIPAAFGARKPKDSVANGKEWKPQKEVDIQEAVREHREAEEEAARRDEEDLRQAASNMTVDEMKKLAVVEDWNYPARDRVASRANGTSDRWDPRWNGRKNFKKFRHQGETIPVRRGQTVIVPLEEVKKKSQGIGEQYWLESMGSNRRQRERVQIEVEEGDEDEEEDEEAEGEHASQSQTFTSAPSHQEEEVPSELVAGSERQVIDVDAPRATRSRDKVSQILHRTETTWRKRSAPSSSKDAGSKRQKTIPMVRDSESDDELKFRFSKKK